MSERKEARAPEAWPIGPWWPEFADGVVALLAAVDDYYDVDDGIPNIPGDIMQAVEQLRAAYRKARGESNG